jgi:chromosome partitioning protein
MIVGVVNQKGGVGKSTIVVHLAVKLFEGGEKVALIDADSQSSSTEWLREAQPEIDCYQWQTAEDILVGIGQLREKYDHILMDGPAGLNEATKSIMMLADMVMIPCGPSALDLRALEEALRVAGEIQATRPAGLPVVRLIPNKLQKRYRLSQELLHAIDDAEIASSSGLSLLSAYADAAGQGTVVWRMGSGAAKATREIEKLFNEIVHDEDVR